MNISIPLPKDYSFEKTAHRVKTFEKTTEIEHDGKLWRALRLSSRAIVTGVCYNQGKHLLIESHDDLSSAEKVELEKWMTYRWATNVDLSDFYIEMSKHPVLSTIVKERIGLHIVRDPDLYECLIRTIISQQLNLAFAGTLINRFIDQFGEKILYMDKWFPVFPTADQIAGLHYQDLTNLQMTLRKAEYIIDLSRSIVEGKMDLSLLHKKSNEEVMDYLLSFRGIGRWTAECLLIFGYGRSNLLPGADIGLRNALQMVYNLKTRPNEADVRILARDWNPYASYVTFYLWDFVTQQNKHPKK
ncbi:DNA-3-methyladenine glycosylase II [Thermoactinomyces sp. DSM 45891]|uniref:DNA-3-methyladenine glycosylase family protein n=1 Tax=Thermoactinomyces sp. DSM 45891 TaxID=1761907 RepID=UPI0009141C6F|nr:DNA-3-methyladenine glycosylase [Thermoactinomyces sp. DSM 45891]SFX72764.1 DNA-3-methyladenine glycosylase II [Thermoactinomyces sp. DSM 45891]